MKKDQIARSVPLVPSFDEKKIEKYSLVFENL